VRNASFRASRQQAALLPALRQATGGLFLTLLPDLRP